MRQRTNEAVLTTCLNTLSWSHNALGLRFTWCFLFCSYALLRLSSVCSFLLLILLSIPSSCSFVAGDPLFSEGFSLKYRSLRLPVTMMNDADDGGIHADGEDDPVTCVWSCCCIVCCLDKPFPKSTMKLGLFVEHSSAWLVTCAWGMGTCFPKFPAFKHIPEPSLAPAVLCPQRCQRWCMRGPQKLWTMKGHETWLAWHLRFHALRHFVLLFVRAATKNRKNPC